MHLLPTTSFVTIITAFLGLVALGNTAALPVENTSLEMRAAEALPVVNVELDKRYNRGRCGIHVRQFKDVKGIDVVVRDKKQIIIGNINRTNFNLGCIDVTSQLPFVIVVCPIKKGELEFRYRGDKWTTRDDGEDGRCSVGKYDGSIRQMDCGFAC